MPCLILLLSPALSQDTGGAPFPTGLTIETVGSEVRLSWNDAHGLEGEIYHIYRHNKAITVEGLNQAQLIGSVAENIQAYRDSPLPGRDWYYLVTVEDKRYHYALVIPYANTLVKAIRLNPLDISLANAVHISRLTARPVKEGVAITFTRDRKGRTVSLYRSTSPITTTEQLNRALPLAVLEQDSWLDNPIPGISYYYAVVDRELLSYKEDISLLYEGNYTVRPVNLPLTDFLNDPGMAYPVRKAPLPTVQLDRFYQNIPRLELDFPPRVELNAQLSKKLTPFLQEPVIEESEEPKAELLRDEPFQQSSPINDKLKGILGEDLLKNRFDEAEKRLLTMLNEVEDDEISSRIHFYRGQCHYFLGNYETAYLEFLLGRDNFYNESVKWMDFCLNQFL
ncbi:MAG: hypothetical protein PQJ59_18780 [Spirochaetales bacterium]|nr:hypothetical protein [Spirochaetales bacterium]